MLEQMTQSGKEAWYEEFFLKNNNFQILKNM